MRTLLIILITTSVFGAHDDFRPKITNRVIAYKLELHYDTLSSVIEYSPYYRWKHLKQDFNYPDYRAHKYLHQRYLPFQQKNAHFHGINSMSAELHQLRPYPTDSRSLEIRLPFRQKRADKIKNDSPFIFP